jgi:hypothetical protein
MHRLCGNSRCLSELGALGTWQSVPNAAWQSATFSPCIWSFMSRWLRIVRDDCTNAPAVLLQNRQWGWSRSYFVWLVQQTRSPTMNWRCATTLNAFLLRNIMWRPSSAALPVYEKYWPLKRAVPVRVPASNRLLILPVSVRVLLHVSCLRRTTYRSPMPTKARVGNITVKGIVQIESGDQVVTVDLYAVRQKLPLHPPSKS